ncbi:MAG: cell division initiation protein [Pseudonocardiales bacterium]|nr:MAG: cell division initiation protein [Pseudonocardiales bacterium]
MSLSPADVANVAFSKPPLGKRGYDEDEVDAFLDVVGAELARLIQDNQGLRDQVEQLGVARVDTGPDLRPLEPPRLVIAPAMAEQTSPGGDHNVRAARVLGLAQDMADRVTGEAKAEADGMLGDARVRSEELLCGARAKADGLVTEARTRAEMMLNDARSKAEIVDRQSRDKAAALECEAARKHAEVIGSLSQEKRALEKKLDELRTFEREYRTRLTTYLTSQLRQLNGRGSVAPAGPMRDQQGVTGTEFDAHAAAG